MKVAFHIWRSLFIFESLISHMKFFISYVKMPISYMRNFFGNFAGMTVFVAQILYSAITTVCCKWQTVKRQSTSDAWNNELLQVWKFRDRWYFWSSTIALNCPSNRTQFKGVPLNFFIVSFGNLTAACRRVPAQFFLFEFGLKFLPA